MNHLITHLLAFLGVDLSLAALLTLLDAVSGVLGMLAWGLGLINMSHLRLCFLTTFTAIFS